MDKLAIIVPYRNREEHLKKFVPHMRDFLLNKDISYNIFIIEQDNDKPFNRGKLLNVGFDQSRAAHTYFCFHDIDMLPGSPKSDYSKVKGACRLSHFVSQFNFIPRPESEFGGGVIMIDKDSFIKVNGFSNDYWGWGVEDNDFSIRCKKGEVPISFRQGRYFSLHHETNGDTSGGTPNEETLKNRSRLRDLLTKCEIGKDGLSDLDYKIKSIEDLEGFTKIKVEI
jgi:hypothetical protein